MKTLLLSTLLTGFISCGDAEAVQEVRQAYRSKQCVSNGEWGYYCKVRLGRFNYCYEVDGQHAISINCKVYEEAKRYYRD